MVTIFKKAILILTIAILTIITAGCQKPENSKQNNDPVNAKDSVKDNSLPIVLTVSAAASLKETMEEIKNLYTVEKPNVKIVYNFGSSGSLLQQIEQGAEVDVFLSAAEKQMNALSDKGLIVKESRVNLLENKLVLITSKGIAGVDDFKEVIDSRIKNIALGDFKSVPVGQYSEEVFTSLGILEKVKEKAVYGKDVKTVLTWVESGNADAGVVYTTDARASNKVHIAAEAAAESHSPIIYPAAIIKGTKNMDEAENFMKFLAGDKAKGVYKKHGFTFANIYNALMFLHCAEPLFECSIKSADSRMYRNFCVIYNLNNSPYINCF